MMLNYIVILNIEASNNDAFYFAAGRNVCYNLSDNRTLFCRMEVNNEE